MPSSSYIHKQKGAVRINPNDTSEKVSEIIRKSWEAFNGVQESEHFHCTKVGDTEHLETEKSFAL